MLALLLAVAAAKSVYLPPQVFVPFPGTTPALVVGPGSPGQEAEVRWHHKQTLYSPAKKAAAVRFCQNFGKYDSARSGSSSPDNPIGVSPRAT